MFPEFKTDKTFFVEPATGRVVTYLQFATDTSCPRNGDDLSSAYSTICHLVSNIIQGNDFCLAEIDVQTLAKPPMPAACSRQFPDDWLRAIRESKSRIRLASSGTTGKPKQTVHSIDSLTRGVRTGDHHQQDVWGLAYPLDHLAGLQVLFQALLNQNTIVQLLGLTTERIHKAIERHRVTHLSCTPTFLKLLATGDQTHPAVKGLTTGGERTDAATLSVLKQVFPNARHRNIYALTEVGNLLIADGEQFTVPAKLESRVKVVDGGLAIHCSLLVSSQETRDERQETRGGSPETRDKSLEARGESQETRGGSLEEGGEGLEAGSEGFEARDRRGASRAQRLPKPDTREPKPDARIPTPETRNPTSDTRDPNPDARIPTPETRNPAPDTRDPNPDPRNPTPETRNPIPDTQTWFVTGDLVEVLVEKPLTFIFLARRDDVINVGGYKVIPQQVEECLSQLPQVRQVVAYGKRNSVTGQIVVCDVVLEPGVDWDPATVKQTLSKVLPRYAVPRIFNVVESLRTTPTGKLCRRSEIS